MQKRFGMVVDEYANLDIICNARYDSVIYDLAPQPTGKKGRPAKHGNRLSPDNDFILSDEKVGEYYIGARRVLTNLFGQREVYAYVTASEKMKGSRRLFFQHHFPASAADILCMAGEGAPESDRKQPYGVYPYAVLLFSLEY